MLAVSARSVRAGCATPASFSSTHRSGWRQTGIRKEGRRHTLQETASRRRCGSVCPDVCDCGAPLCGGGAEEKRAGEETAVGTSV